MSAAVTPMFKLKMCPIKPKSAIVGGNSNACDGDGCAWWVSFAANGKITGGHCAIPLIATGMMNLDISTRSLAVQLSHGGKTIEETPALDETPKG
jgi:hypothetical protein